MGYQSWNNIPYKHEFWLTIDLLSVFKNTFFSAYFMKRILNLWKKPNYSYETSCIILPQVATSYIPTMNSYDARTHVFE